MKGFFAVIEYFGGTCSVGHPRTTENVYVEPKSGIRHCRPCAREWHRYRTAKRRLIAENADSSQIEELKRAWDERQLLRRLNAAFTVHSESGCWEWKQSAPTGDYGHFRHGELDYAHRATYTLLKGEIPDGLLLDHLCRNPPCVNPDHLEPVTHRENTLRGNAAVARTANNTHCFNGHEFTPENTAHYGRNRHLRKCRICARAAKNACMARKRAQAAQQQQ